MAEDVFGDELRRQLGGGGLYSTSPEELVELAEEESRREMGDIAAQAGFESVDAVLVQFNDKMSDDANARFNKRLNSATPDAQVALHELIDRLESHDRAVAQEAGGGFGTHMEVIAATEEASAARRRGEPDRALELKIGNTPDRVIEGRPG